MKHFILVLIIAVGMMASDHLPLVPVEAAPAPLRTTLISRVEQGDTVVVTYLLEASVIPDTQVTDGTIVSQAAQYEPARGWRVTVHARLDRCAGLLTAMAGEITQILTQQRCTLLPQVFQR